MLRTDEENQRWWDSLTVLEKSEIFGFLASKAQTSALGFLASLKRTYDTKGVLSTKQLAALRKFNDQVEA